MILDIISGDRSGMFKRLEGLGLIKVAGVNFVRQPFRVKGVWRCTVIV